MPTAELPNSEDASECEARASELYKSGNIGSAIEIYEARVRTHPEDLAASRSLARRLAESRQFPRAEAAISEALALFGADTVLLALLVFVKQEQGLSEQARDIAAHAALHYPASLSFQFDSRLLLPMVYTDKADLLAHRQRFETGLAELEAMLPSLQQDATQIHTLARSNFLLAYQGENDLSLQRRYASILGSMIDAADPALRARQQPEQPAQIDSPRSTASGKIRVGFVGKWFYACTAGNYFERWITHLDASRFERFVYYTGQTDDAVTARIGAAADHFVRLQGDAHSNAQRIRADALDILIYPEVGMSTGSYLLANCRLARTQCAAWGHPVTTGSSMIDVYFSCRAMEPADYQTHYSERVVLFDGIGVDFALPGLAAIGSRADFGLPAAARLYFCPQSLFKIHPDMDAAFVDILERDHTAVLVFFQADSRAITMAFADRLTGALAIRDVRAKGQVKFLPRLSQHAFRQALRLADVILDPFHWSGGGTSLDAFAGDVPVVTLPGRFMRGRQTAAMLRMMNADALIAANVEAYVNTAIDIAGNPSLNHDLRTLISANKQALFDRHDLTDNFSRALLQLVNDRG